MANPRIVAAFDVDGTLSSRDNFLRFVRLVSGSAATARALAVAATQLARARRDPAQRDVAKATVLRMTMRGRRDASLRDLGHPFAREIAARHLHPEVVARLEAHRAAGHACVMVSASLPHYLDPLAELLGVDAVLATELEADADGVLTGEIRGVNVRGAEKARRLDEWLGGAPATVFAYGDSRGDTELLARADHPVRVDRRGRVPASAAAVSAATPETDDVADTPHR